jgi:adenylate cyclase
MESLNAYLPQDRRRAMARGESLPHRTSGAALFADVSGFTPLTEALLKELGPRHGADELSRQLNLVYDTLIAVVDRYGGNVITFGGDAITCWFDGDDGAQATTCALVMQEGMRRFAEITTPSGIRLSLAMKAAVAIGPARRFQVGDPHIQYLDVLTGATLTHMAEAEQHANKQEVVLSPETSAQLSNKVEVVEWRADVGTGRRFAVVTSMTDRLESSLGAFRPLASNAQLKIHSGQQGDAEILSEAQLRPWLLPPVYERLMTGQGQFLAEIRPATALFLKFGGINYDGDEEAGAKLDAFITWAQNILVQYEGYLLQLIMGDKGSYLYTAFGAPIAHDDDTRRAVAAALELRSLPVYLDFIDNVQIGISQGRIWAGAYGSLLRRTYGVLGDEVNLAARLMGKAEPGQILVSQRVADTTSQNYQFKSIGLVKVKGKRNPLPVFVALDRQQLQTPEPVRANPLVGREAELEYMEQILTSVLAGAGQILRLEGPAGVGKSRLVAEIVVRASGRGFRVATSVCQSISQNVAYSSWREIFQTLLADLGFPVADVGRADQSASSEERPVIQNSTEALRSSTGVMHDSTRTLRSLQAALASNPSWLLRLPLLGDLLGVRIPDNTTTATFDPRLRQAALFSLVVELVQSWAQTQPMMLVLEDIHWMGEASLGLTLALGRVISGSPILLVLVQRPSLSEGKPLLSELDQLPYYHHLALNELPPHGIAALITHRLQGGLSALALSLIQAQAQGNPFFAEELVNTLCETGRLYRQSDGMWTLSETMIEALHDAQCLIRSSDAAPWMLDPNASLSAVDLGIPDSVHGVILARLDRLPEAPKVTLKVASVIGCVCALDLLAQAHPARPNYESLLEQLKMLETLDFARVEMSLPQPIFQFRHNITQEVAYETLLEAQRQELHQAVAETLERLRPDAVEQLTYHYSRSKVRRKAVLYLDKAAHKTQREYANETALNYYHHALALGERWEWRKGQVEVLHILGRRAEEEVALRALEAAAAPVFEVAYLRAQYDEAVGNYAGAQAAIERALAACQLRADLVGEIRCLAHLGLIARRQGNYDRAKVWYEQALEADRSSNDISTKAVYSDEEAQALAQALNGLGTVLRQQGNFDEAKQCYEQALALSRKSGNRKDEAEALNSLGVTAFYQRNFADALRYHRQTLEIRRAIGDRAGEGASLLNLAQVVRDAGGYGQAQEYLAEALLIQQFIGNRWEEVNICNSLGGVYLLIGDLAAAQICLQHGLQLGQEIGDRVGQVYVLGNLGLVAESKGNWETAERLFIDGLALAQALEDRYVVSYFLSRLGFTSLQLGRPDEAIELAGAALALRLELELRLWTTADLATLAGGHLALGHVDQALNYVQQTLNILADCGGEGPEFPQHDYFVCYQVLSAAGEEMAAHTALHSAYQLVMKQAGKIADPVIRQSFLERVQVNREIVQTANRYFLQSNGKYTI